MRACARGIISYNNQPAVSRARSLIRGGGFEIIRRIPRPAAGILYRSRIESFPRCSAHPPQQPPSAPQRRRHRRGALCARCRPNFLIHEKWDRSHTREKQNLRVFGRISSGGKCGRANTGKFPRAPIYIQTIVHPFGGWKEGEQRERERFASILRLTIYVAPFCIKDYAAINPRSVIPLFRSPGI